VFVGTHEDAILQGILQHLAQLAEVVVEHAKLFPAGDGAPIRRQPDGRVAVRQRRPDALDWPRHGSTKLLFSRTRLAGSPTAETSKTIGRIPAGMTAAGADTVTATGRMLPGSTANGRSSTISRPGR